DARDIGQLTASVELKNRLSASDTLDYYKFSLNAHAGINIAGTTAAPITVELIDELQKVYVTGRIGTGSSPAPISSAPLLPGTYFVKLSPAGTPGQAGDRYALTLVAD